MAVFLYRAVTMVCDNDVNFLGGNIDTLNE